MATNKKSSPRYDLNAQDRKRDMAIRLGLTALVIVFAAAVVLYIVMTKDKKGSDGDVQAVRISSSALMKKDGGDEPKAVLSIYEDFQCPHCGLFEKNYQGTIDKLIDNGVDPKHLPDHKLDMGDEAKAWKTVWSAGQGSGSIHDVMPAADLVARLSREFHDAVTDLSRRFG